jgi:hypothetical protein
VVNSVSLRRRVERTLTLIICCLAGMLCRIPACYLAMHRDTRVDEMTRYYRTRRLAASEAQMSLTRLTSMLEAVFARQTVALAKNIVIRALLYMVKSKSLTVRMVRFWLYHLVRKFDIVTRFD